MQTMWMLAAGDLLTFSLTTAALWWLTSMIGLMDAESGYLAGLGALMISFGGGLSSLNRFSRLATGQSLFGWSIDLFQFLTPGFVCLAYGLWYGQQALRLRRTTQIWLAPMLTIFAIQGFAALMIGRQNGPSQFIVLLSFTSIASFIMIGLCIRQARWQGLRTAIIFSAAYLTMVSSMNIIAHSFDEQNDLMISMVLTTNMLAALCFAGAGWILYQSTKRRRQLQQIMALLDDSLAQPQLNGRAGPIH
jgi:hypothetical protein